MIETIHRLIRELGRTSAGDGANALARLRVRTEAMSDGKARVGVVGDEGEPLSGCSAGAFDVVHLPRGLYASVPGRADRVNLLRLARDACLHEVHIDVRVNAAQTHAGQVAFDAPRRLLRAVGLPAAEPGDRFGGGAFVHLFFDEEPLIDEIWQADLDLVRRQGTTFVLTKARPRMAGEKTSFAAEVGRALCIVRDAEHERLRSPPERALEAMRRRGAMCARRNRVGRARLRRAVGWVDAFVPGGPNCYRRTLMELALDAGAAREDVVFGLDVGRTGHISFADEDEGGFDVAFASSPMSPPDS